MTTTCDTCGSELIPLPRDPQDTHFYCSSECFVLSFEETQ